MFFQNIATLCFCFCVVLVFINFDLYNNNKCNNNNNSNNDSNNNNNNKITCHDGVFLVDMTTQHDNIDCDRWNEATKLAFTDDEITIEMYTEEQLAPLVGKSPDDVLAIRRSKARAEFSQQLSTASMPKVHHFTQQWSKIFDNNTHSNRVPIITIYPISIRDILVLNNGNKFNLDDEFIMLGAFADNHGTLSSYVFNRTVKWYHLDLDIAKEKCRSSSQRPWRPCQFQDITRFMDNDKLRLFIHTQHSVIGHPKIVQIPLGITNGNMLSSLLSFGVKAKKTKWLLLSSSNWGTRPQQYSIIQKNFKGIKNQRFDAKHYLLALRDARFIVAPSGFGADCYRILEAIMFGCVPIIERGYHIERGYSKLPILVVDRWENLTLALLKNAYREILYNRPFYEPKRFLKSFWKSFIEKVAAKNMSLEERNELIMKEFPMPLKWQQRHYHASDYL